MRASIPPAVGRDAGTLPDGARVAVLVNGAARHAGGARWEPLVRKILARRLDPEFLHPGTVDEMAHAALQVARNGAAAIVVAGGDGTICRVVRAVAGLAVPVAILPLGTANDLARALGIPPNLLGAAHRVVEGSFRRMDLLEVNGEPFATVGGLGLASDAALAANRVRQGARLRRLAGALGTRVYSLAAAAGILFQPSIGRHVRLAYRAPEGGTQALACACAALFVANQSSLGGGLALPTDSRSDDGVFELCLVPRSTRVSLLASLARLAAGRAVDFPVVRAVEARVECDAPAAFFGDGEGLAYARGFTLRVRPAALGVIA